jgi:GntR family transcriptional regulator/MocR family aminotransferase
MRKTAPGILPLIAVDRGSSKPLYRQVYEGYRDAIVERRLEPGQQLPSTRGLAEELRISRIPVLNAFEQLKAEGYFEARIGSGTFVAGSVPDELLASVRAIPAPKPMLGRGRRAVSLRTRTFLSEKVAPWFASALGAFSVGQPPVDGLSVKVWSKLVTRHSRNRDASVHYGSPMGLACLREAVAKYLRSSRAVRCEPEQIMIVNGSQQALDLASRTLLDPESPVWVEEPGYFGVRRALSLADARLIPVPVDGEGMDVSVGIARCPRARAAFVTPSHQFPLGVTMSATRRLRLLDWARRSGAWVIEDDYDSEFRYGNLPIGALQGLDRDARVIYIGTFSKILFPALRLGYIVIPADLVEAFVKVRRAMDFFSSTFYQAVLADFIREGHFGRHIRRVRLLCRERRAVLVDAIRDEFGDGLHVVGDQAGMYLTATLPRGVRDHRISEHAARSGLWAAPLSACYLGNVRREGLLLGYGGIRVEEIEIGVRRLRNAVREEVGTLRRASGPH